MAFVLASITTLRCSSTANKTCQENAWKMLPEISIWKKLCKTAGSVEKAAPAYTRGHENAQGQFANLFPRLDGTREPNRGGFWRLFQENVCLVYSPSDYKNKQVPFSCGHLDSSSEL